MKLTSQDQVLLIKYGHPKSDFRQIERALNKTTYETNGKKITREEAINILGTETYLSGISRSAFHWSAFRENEKGQGVYFNSSQLFK
jgi:hypothetical protein